MLSAFFLLVVVGALVSVAEPEVGLAPDDSVAEGGAGSVMVFVGLMC